MTTTPAALYLLELLEEFPNTPTKTLARKAYEAHPELWTDLENARSMLRYYRGAKGAKMRKHAVQLREFDPSLWNPFNFPGSDETEYLPFMLPEDCKRILWMSDIHVPYHNVEVHGENLGKKEGPSHGDHEQVLDDGHRAHRQVEHGAEASTLNLLFAGYRRDDSNGAEPHQHHRAESDAVGATFKCPCQAQGQFEERINEAVRGHGLGQEVVRPITRCKTADVEELEE